MKSKETSAEANVASFNKKQKEKSSSLQNINQLEKRWLTLKKMVTGMLAIALMGIGAASLAPRTGEDPSRVDKKRLAVCNDFPDTIAKSACYGSAFSEILTRQILEDTRGGKVYLNLTIYKGKQLVFTVRSHEIDLKKTPLDLEPLYKIEEEIKKIDVTDPEMSIFLYAVHSAPYNPGTPETYSESYMAAYLPELTSNGQPIFYNAISSSCAVRDASHHEHHYLLHSVLASNYGEKGRPEELTVTETGIDKSFQRYTYPTNRRHTANIIECMNKATPLFQEKYVSLTKSQAGK